MDWDKLKIFHAVTQAGSFTKAGDVLNLSQSAISRQIQSLEYELKCSLFQRHARGLSLTENGETLYKTANEVISKIKEVETDLVERKEKPSGKLIITTVVGFGGIWLTPRIKEFRDKNPDIEVELIVTNDELDLSMREADIAIKFHKPTQLDLIQRKLFTVHFHIYASPEYLEENGTPNRIEDLPGHKIVSFNKAPEYLKEINWLENKTKEYKIKPILTVSNIKGILIAAASGIGIALLPDYLVSPEDNLIKIPFNAKLPEVDTYLTYPEERKKSKRIAVFKDFIIEKGKAWSY